MLTPISAYAIDAMQRGILFLDLLRRRGNTAIEMSANPIATVLRFDHELIMSGHALPRPINYALLRILPPPGSVTDHEKRPVVVVDPRAGQGPGIGGFKAESEIGDALKAGHPVYFIGFSAKPEPGQQFLDVVEGQIKFFERVVALHPHSPLPFAIGNCQAGYQTLMVAMLRPDLFGPCLVVGSPMSYWQGVRGKDPMRYSGGLSGGSWMTALISDLGNGTFDGTWLVENFDKLGPANWLWGKQYAVYADVDTGGERYLEFEKWWGDFIQLNGDELQFLVDNLFIGDKLVRNQLKSNAGTIFDLRTISSPIIVFASTGDNISPPPQALGWLVDLYRDVDEMRAAGQTIVYCLSQTAGHLALFVSSKVGAEQDAEFVQMIDVIDCLPPGLFEMVISPRPSDSAASPFVTGDWIARIEPRDIADISALGRNSPADDRAFAAVAKVSEINLALYRSFLQPWVRALVNQPMADAAAALNPMRLSYTIFADRNPWMGAVQSLATSVAAARMPVSPKNPFLVQQTRVSNQIIAGLQAYRIARDRLSERMFFGFYGSPVVQASLGIARDREVRPALVTSPEKLAEQRANSARYEAGVTEGGFNEALIRALLYVIGASGALDQRSALALDGARQQIMSLSLAAFKAMVREQFFIMVLAPDAAIEALTSMVPGQAERTKLLLQTGVIVAAAGPPSDAERACLDRLSNLLADEPAPSIPKHKLAAE